MLDFKPIQFDSRGCRRNVLLPVDPRQRINALLVFRRAHEAHRDAAMLFKAAAEGRPMELAKRFRLGKLAGGLQKRGRLALPHGKVLLATPLEAARMGGHTDCVAALEYKKEVRQ